MLELLDRQEKLTANQWKIAIAATLGDMLDFFDFFLIGFVLAFIVKDWHLTYGQSGMILLAFADGSLLRLEVECVEARLSDMELRRPAEACQGHALSDASSA